MSPKTSGSTSSLPDSSYHHYRSLPDKAMSCVSTTGIGSQDSDSGEAFDSFADYVYQVWGFYFAYAASSYLLCCAHLAVALALLAGQLAVAAVCLSVPLLWPLVVLFLRKRYDIYIKRRDESLIDFAKMETPASLADCMSAELRPEEMGRFVTRDRLSLTYEVFGSGPAAILLCNGVNCSSMLWAKIYEHVQKDMPDFKTKYRVVTWNYRGLFGSDQPKHGNAGKCSVHHLVDDAVDLMHTLGVRRWHAVMGWSTGVQVAGQLAASYPEFVDRVILCNGNAGQTLTTAFSVLPLVGNFVLGRLLHLLIFAIRFAICPYPQAYARVAGRYRRAVLWMRKYLWHPMGILHGNPAFEWLFALNWWDLFGNGPVHTNNTGIILQALDSHSMEMVLPEVQTPVLIITGLLDIMTPAFQSYGMAGLLPKVHLVPFMGGSHHCILEYPRVCSSLITEFIESSWGAFRANHSGKIRLKPVMEDKPLTA